MSQAVSYPPRVVEFARRMGENGCKVVEIQAALGRRGYRPHETTVARWADPAYAEAYRLKRRRQRQGRLTRGPRGWQLKLDRMHNLRGLRVSYRSIAAVINHDFGLQITTEQARSILQERLSDESIRALLNGQPIRSGRRGAVNGTA